jgi:outer membrane protein assembly factor BamB
MKFNGRITASVALAALALAPIVASSAPASAAVAQAAVAQAAVAQAAARASHPQVPGGNRLWQVKFDGGAGRIAQGDSVTASPDGSTVYVSGLSAAAKTLGNGQVVTVAYNAATGAVRWTAVYKSTAHHPRGYTFTAVSPDSSTLFVSGKGVKIPSTGYQTVAFNTATGAQLWQAHTSGDGQAESVAVSPDGSAVYVTGDLKLNVAETVAYNAATGAREWTTTYAGPKKTNPYARQVAVSPDGSTVYTLAEGIVAGHEAYLVLAYDATSGAQLWTQTLSGPSNDSDYPATMAVNGTGVFVTGSQDTPPYATPAMATVAFQQ